MRVCILIYVRATIIPAFLFCVRALLYVCAQCFFIFLFDRATAKRRSIAYKHFSISSIVFFSHHIEFSQYTIRCRKCLGDAECAPLNKKHSAKHPFPSSKNIGFIASQRWNGV